MCIDTRKYTHEHFVLPLAEEDGYNDNKNVECSYNPLNDKQTCSKFAKNMSTM